MMIKAGVGEDRLPGCMKLPVPAVVQVKVQRSGTLCMEQAGEVPPGGESSMESGN